MDQQHNEAVMSDAATKVGDTVGDLAARSEKVVQDKIDRAKPVLRDLQESAGAVLDRATELAQKASSAGALAIDAVQGAARDVANQTSQAAATVYQQGARAGGSVSRFATEQPLTALLVAAAIGYGAAYLVHRS